MKNILLAPIALVIFISSNCTLAVGLHDKVPSVSGIVPDCWRIFAHNWAPVTIRDDVEPYMDVLASENRQSDEYPPGINKRTIYSFNYNAYKANFYDMNAHFVNESRESKRKALQIWARGVNDKYQWANHNFSPQQIIVTLQEYLQQEDGIYYAVAYAAGINCSFKSNPFPWTEETLYRIEGCSPAVVIQQEEKKEAQKRNPEIKNQCCIFL